MDIVIKILFIMALFTFNITVIRPLMNQKDEVIQKAGFMVLFGFNVLLSTAILVILHPYMTDNTGALIGSGFIGGGVIFAVSTLPFSNFPHTKG